MGSTRNAYRILGGKPTGKRPFGRSRHTQVHTLYSSPYIKRAINPRRMRQAGQVACMG
jgi:hypothetical protein